MCYNGKDETFTTCDFTSKGIKDAYRSMIESVVWNTGGVTWNASGRDRQSAKSAYEIERGTTTGQICKGTTYKDGAWCTDDKNNNMDW